MNVAASVGKIEWNTAIWFDSNENTYLLPIKSEIRRKTHLQLNQNIDVTIWI